MPKGEKPEFVLVTPIATKYCEFYVNNQLYKVWRVHPSSPNRVGTPVPYDVAVSALCKKSPVISVVPIEKGKSPILDEDREKIKQSLALGFQVYRNYNQGARPSAGDPEAISKAMEMLSRQDEENKKLKASLEASTKAQEALMKRLDELEKKAAGTAG